MSPKQDKGLGLILLMGTHSPCRWEFRGNIITGALGDGGWPCHLTWNESNDEELILLMTPLSLWE